MSASVRRTAVPVSGAHGRHHVQRAFGPVGERRGRPCSALGREAMQAAGREENGFARPEEGQWRRGGRRAEERQRSWPAGPAAAEIYMRASSGRLQGTERWLWRRCGHTFTRRCLHCMQPVRVFLCDRLVAGRLDCGSSDMAAGDWGMQQDGHQVGQHRTEGGQRLASPCGATRVVRSSGAGLSPGAPAIAAAARRNDAPPVAVGVWPSPSPSPSMLPAAVVVVPGAAGRGSAAGAHACSADEQRRSALNEWHGDAGTPGRPVTQRTLVQFRSYPRGSHWPPRSASADPHSCLRQPLPDKRRRSAPATSLRHLRIA